ncbi:NAD(P)H-quinone oxidoreductase subunit M, chloroplastic-like [Olea europaea var. sylvestris]|uniref:NAD(P)H-quinone oxidoreductase subunit M, chloroplastic-like n=1 Tax=Olea europaea var. sylvestris TaxID=158386 RepID=UPI000C1D008A|nr:NAD(P)H-quinone oxidoreductase subunit M, chloroplastic-like [Olea europaea var. sylvestris]XP_022880494.1 NAD(P)H-quinone oxidoreductase subunit M, chloroplastic-like [Olea europaea var. sylvestris]
MAATSTHKASTNFYILGWRRSKRELRKTSVFSVSSQHAEVEEQMKLEEATEEKNRKQQAGNDTHHTHKANRTSGACEAKIWAENMVDSGLAAPLDMLGFIQLILTLNLANSTKHMDKLTLILDPTD